jgi:hypothetical protein
MHERASHDLPLLVRAYTPFTSFFGSTSDGFRALPAKAAAELLGFSWAVSGPAREVTNRAIRRNLIFTYSRGGRPTFIANFSRECSPFLTLSSARPGVFYQSQLIRWS